MYMVEKKKQTVTSLRVDPKLWKKAKIEAIKREITLAELVDRALKNELKIENRVKEDITE